MGAPLARIVRIKWERPSEGRLKLNVNTAVDGTLGHVGVGGIVRDWNSITITLFAKSFAFSHVPTRRKFLLCEKLSYGVEISLYW
ncbi:hypothetical protein PanWU01x14_155730 [Parasponia andersonii]|uniref:RNase H type-1 domain-containing protein n=1 Tax=Parasponia andersonii TaxID=3476 RepID=A0A2P5CG85_PARAD|nr:hypothetical protein PanWU01x14_155730 [Parasponia andersonii]